MNTPSSDSFQTSYRALMTGLFFLIGLVYMVIRRFFRSGDLIFGIIFVMLTIWMLWAIHWAHFSSDAVEDASLRGEYTGVAIIAGISASIGIPLLHRSHKFELFIV